MHINYYCGIMCLSYCQGSIHSCFFFGNRLLVFVVMFARVTVMMYNLINLKASRVVTECNSVFFFYK